MSYPTELVDEITKLRAENAALAEQNAKMREALKIASARFSLLAASDDSMRNGVKPSVGYADCQRALALPDLTKADELEGMK